MAGVRAELGEFVVVGVGLAFRTLGASAQVEVMRGQMENLTQISRRPNITIQAVPYAVGGHSGLLGGFIIAEMGTSPGIVFLEAACDGRVAEDTAMVTQAMRNFDALRSEALTQGMSQDLIEKAAKERWT